MQRPRITTSEKLSHLCIQRITPGNLFVHPILKDARGGVVAKQVIDSGRQLQAAFVAVAGDALQPFRVDYTGTEDTQCLLPKITHSGVRWVVGIAEIMLRLAAGQGADSSNHTAVKLKIVITVEDVMLTVVLVVQGCLHAGQPVTEHTPRVHA